MAKIVILTGAGISAESGLKTFRDDGGLWEGHRVEDVATPEAFGRNASLVHQFYNQRRRDLAKVAPNAAHRALGTLMASSLHEVTIVTQNVDDLHERGGCPSVWHMHGQLLKKRCEWCGAVSDCSEDLSQDDRCSECEQTGGMRPDIVWFGEMPYFLEKIDGVLSDCDLFVAIGTSGAVYPAGNFVNLARLSGARTLELNLVRTDNSGNFDEVREGPASVKVGEWVEEILAD
ncbi:NAD-dependent deacylase [Roseibacillus persicicus]|uniref:NAD-dependent deacylase n=1 Tax=Roseibacillus persicicus TaxID=454148 RepID=UPI00280F995E|nr:NAD-dependent deacylase [Roseibacillus persicicus]MDQ8188813.1 NAD-dependent deacylase [Roseibacillus persicicus]